jgi:hypothetical protein
VTHVAVQEGVDAPVAVPALVNDVPVVLAITSVAVHSDLHEIVGSVGSVSR